MGNLFLRHENMGKDYYEKKHFDSEHFQRTMGKGGFGGDGFSEYSSRGSQIQLKKKKAISKICLCTYSRKTL